MRPVHKNNVKYLSGVSNWRARHNNSLPTVGTENGSRRQKNADLTTPK